MSYTFNVSFGPDHIKKVIVVSHERSGTHFLMNTLAENFGYISFPWINLDLDYPVNYWAPENVLNFLNLMKSKPVLNTLKSHHEVGFLLPILDEILEEFHLFYIYRDGNDVMESFYKHLNFYDWDVGPRAASGAELARMQPSGAMLRYQKRQYPTIWDRWQNHVTGWLAEINDRDKRKITAIKFEALKEDFNRTVQFIASCLGRNCFNPVKPHRYDRVITPDEEGFRNACAN